MSKMKKEDKIYLLRRIVQDEELSDEALATYVGIRYLMTKNKACFFSDYILYRILFGHVAGTKDKKLINLRNGMREFFDSYDIGNEYIGVNTYMLDECDKEDLYIDTLEPAFDDFGFFFSVSWKHINKIMSVKGNVDKYKLLRLYLVMASTINLNTHIGFTGRDKISELTGISSATITKYQKILVNLNVLYIVKNGAIQDKKTGKVINLANTYSFYEDAKECEQRAKDKRILIRKDMDDSRWWNAFHSSLDDEDLDMSDMLEENEMQERRKKGKIFLSSLSTGNLVEHIDESKKIDLFNGEIDYDYEYDYYTYE